MSGYIDVLLLDNLWRIYRGSSRYVEWRLDMLMECSLPQFLVMRTVASSDCTVVPANVAEALGCSRANIGRLVEQLEDVQWITKTRNLRDARALSLRLTPRGNEAYEDGFGELAEAAHELFAPLMEEEKELLLELLRKIRPVLPR